MLHDLQIKKVEKVHSIRDHIPDDIFISCGSFEDRFLGVPEKLEENFSENFILFRFTEPNDKRKRLIRRMENILDVSKNFGEKYHQIDCEHGKSIQAVLKVHRYLQREKMNLKKLLITIDISTFTKDLLINLLFYINNFVRIDRLRLLYTIPRKYASPEEGPLSYGIRRINISPMCWNGWSPIKDNILIILLGFEEMRAWSLLDRFNASENWLFVTSPGSIPEWNTFCQRYNQRLLKEISEKDKIPALSPDETSKILSKYVTAETAKKYNIFISPLGSKPQIIGVLNLCMCKPDIPINILTTTTVKHNVPYYSWDTGGTFEFFSSVKNDDKYERK